MDDKKSLIEFLENLKKDLEKNTKSIEQAINIMYEYSSKQKSENTTELSSFLASVGNSVIESQQNLDVQSEKYLAKNKDKPYLPPTIFRIPKITAELNLGLQKRTGDNLNVLLFSKKSEAEEIQQQTIKMEIIAVPAPVETMQRIREDLPKLNIVLDALERRKLFSLLESEVYVSSARKFLDLKNRTIFCKTYEPDKYLIFFAETEKTGKIDMWRLDLNLGELKSENNLKNAKAFKEFIHNIINKQELLFNG